MLSHTKTLMHAHKHTHTHTHIYHSHNTNSQKHNLPVSGALRMREQAAVWSACGGGRSDSGQPGNSGKFCGEKRRFTLINGYYL